MGVFAGVFIAAAFLNYSGTKPLNVSIYIFGIVVVQFGFSFFIFATLILRFFSGMFFHDFYIYSVVEKVVFSFFSKIKNMAKKIIAVKSKSNNLSVLDFIRGKNKFYNSLFYWPLFILFQLFGIGFNIGIIAVTLITINNSDLVFGWKTTMQLSNHTVYSVVRTIALPWSWVFPEGVAYPSFKQIISSHIILKGGGYHLASQKFVLWWPFLCLSVFTYGLLPRVILFIIGIIPTTKFKYF